MKIFFIPETRAFPSFCRKLFLFLIFLCSESERLLPLDSDAITIRCWGSTRAKHFSYISLTFKTERNQERNICTLSTQRRIPIKHSDHVAVYLYFYIFYFPLVHKNPSKAFDVFIRKRTVAWFRFYGKLRRPFSSLCRETEQLSSGTIIYKLIDGRNHLSSCEPTETFLKQCSFVRNHFSKQTLYAEAHVMWDVGSYLTLRISSTTLTLITQTEQSITVDSIRHIISILAAINKENLIKASELQD